MGMHGTARIVTRHRESVALLPIEALRGAVLDGAEIVLCQAGEARVSAVEVGYRDATRFEVRSGLPDGVKVAVDHVLGLSTGAKIRER